MSIPIGFTEPSKKSVPSNENAEPVISEPVPSIVRVFFPSRNLTCSYYNDSFCLSEGDLVWVEGKLEGHLGKVKEVNLNFKIKLSDYKKVIGIVENNVSGDFYLAESHIVSFDSEALPFRKAVSWFMPPKLDEDIVFGSDNYSFHLDNLADMKISRETAERGEDYYLNNKVSYLEISNGNGKAIISGGSPYLVEFRYDEGNISRLVCSCFCAGRCKHEFAAMLQLRETLSILREKYPEINENSYFSAVYRPLFFDFIVNKKGFGKLSFNPGN